MLNKIIESSVGGYYDSDNLVCLNNCLLTNIWIVSLYNAGYIALEITAPSGATQIGYPELSRVLRIVPSNKILAGYIQEWGTKARLESQVKVRYSVATFWETGKLVLQLMFDLNLLFQNTWSYINWWLYIILHPRIDHSYVNIDCHPQI